MYATYTYAPGSTAANILADVVKILTGETNLANLSANCVQAQSSILTNASVAGWSVYDASAGTNAQCIRAAYNDDAANYKYVVVDTNTAGYIFLKGWESWNSGGHSGTNLAYKSDLSTGAQRLNIALGGILYIKANQASILMFSLQNGSFGNSANATGFGIFERTRTALWDTVANNLYPLLIAADLNCVGAGAATATSPRIPGIFGAPDITGISANMYFAAITGSQPNYFPGYMLSNNKFMLGANKEQQAIFLSLSANNLSFYGFPGGDISSLSDVYVTNYNFGGFGDHCTYNGHDYIIWPASVQSRIALRCG